MKSRRRFPLRFPPSGTKVVLHIGTLCVALLTAANAPALSSAPHVVASDSVLFSDGSIERSVIQPMHLTRESARTSPAWERLSGATNSNGKFTAKGRFDSVDAMPAYFEHHMEDVDRLENTQRKRAPSTLERRYERNDHVFVVEHRWVEHLTYGYGLNDLVTAADDLLEWYSQLLVDALEAQLRPEYEATPYLHMFRSVWAPVIKELIEFDVGISIREGRSPESETFAQAWKMKRLQVQKRLKQELPSVDVPEFFQEDPTLSWVLLLLRTSLVSAKYGTTFLFSRLVESSPDLAIRRKDGTPLGKITLDAIWRADAESALKRLGDEKYGGEKGFERRQDYAMRRILGPYWCGFVFCKSYDFLFSMTMPGYIVDSNGERKAANQVAWNFDWQRLYPLGLRMQARSLEPDLETQRALTGWQPFETVEEMQEFVDLAAGDPWFGKWLAQSREAGWLLPEASFLLAEHYRMKNSAKQWFWFCQAAREGHQRTLFYLASWYGSLPNFWNVAPDRRVIVPDDHAAYVWYSIAENHGYEFAAKDKNRIAARLSQASLEQAERMLESWTPDMCPWPGS